MRYSSDSTSRLMSASPMVNHKLRLLKKPITPWNIAFDIDGVVADTMDIFVEMVRKKLGIHNFSKEDLTEYELYRCLPQVSREKVEEILWLILSDEYTQKVPPCDGAPEVLGRLAHYSTLRFVTARIWPESITEWLYKTIPFVDKNRVKVVATGDPKIKSKVLKEMGVEVFLEDRWDTCKNLKEEGVEVILYDQPWNRKGNDFLRINHWKELEALIIWP